ncbi:radical SAM protein [Candidatus Gracilibacteria bacterium]|nr:radical SAM protein [Candidatus Gracilibacteria bacterium]
MQYKVFGCKVNKYYTDRWLNSEYLSDKTGTFVASCVVTDSAKRKWIRFVKQELKNISENGKIYISGCGAFKNGKAQDDFFTLYPDLSAAQDKIEILDEAPIDTAVKEKLTEDGKVQKIDLSKLKKAQKTQIYTKKFILIQGGCDSFCSFCLTVQKRGRHYYRAAEDIAEEIRDFEDQGGKEVVLTGVNLSAWGLENTHDIKNFSQDLVKSGISGGGSRFSELLTYLLENTDIPRLRISSLGPEFIDDSVLNILGNERIYPHFHFSIQSGSTNVLKSMARHYDGDFMKDLLNKTRKIKREDDVSISIGADIIVGFPGESEEDFIDTYNLVKDCKITKLHAFPFSAHTMGESVPAGKFKDQISDSVKKDRMNRLMKLGDDVREEFRNSQRGKTLKILVEKTDGNIWSGWSENYLEADESNFEIIAGTVKKNNIIVGKFK